MAEYKAQGGEHKLTLLNQEQLDVSGVVRVESFNPEEVVLETNCGLIQIKGAKLDVKNVNLELGVMDLVGIVSEIRYCREKTQGRRSVFAKLFR